MSQKIVFLGGARYSRPLDATSAKKYEALAQLGDVFVIAFSQDPKPRRFAEHAEFYLFPKWPLPVLRYLTMFIAGPWLTLWLIWRRKVRVLVAQSPYEGFAAAWAKIVARWLWCRVALVVENHGDFEESLFLQRWVWIPWLYRRLMQWVAHFALRHADLLRVVSNSTWEQLQRWAPGKSVVQFPTWTDIEIFLQAGANRPIDNAPTVLYAGVLIPRKGVHHLIQAFFRIANDFPDAKLIIVGRNENPTYGESLRSEVDRLDLDGRVQFVGEVSQTELARQMAQAQVCVLPTYSEGLPRVVFEAMAAGTPVIATPVSGIPDVIQDGVTGLLCSPGDEAMLAERLRWILAHPREARFMGKRAEEFARSFFSTGAYVNEYRRLFIMAENMLQGRRAEHASSAL